MQSEEIKKIYGHWRKRLYGIIPISVFKNRKVLDVGCGDGEDAFFISKIANRVYGIDMEKSDKWQKYKSKNLHFRVSDAQKLPFKNNYFEGVYLKDVLHHVENPRKVINEINRVTKKGSVIILLEGNRYNPIFYFHMTKMKGHEHLSEFNFKKIILEKFNNIEFYKFESHYIPILSYKFYRISSFLIESFFSIPIINKYQSYNMAIIKK